MSTKYDNSGTLSRNRRKEKDSHPDFAGQATINGVEYWMSGWVKEGRDGKFFSLSFKPKEARQSDSGNRRDNRGSVSVANDLDDEIPF